jgi:3-deoxy-D-manno-octulosonic-acid transferase
MLNNLAVKAGFWFYDLVWQVAIPVFRLNHRLADGFEQRMLQQDIPPADLWIQAASAGESYLVSLILKKLKPPYPIRILLTSNTAQGVEILERAINDTTPNARSLNACVAYFPFDKPTIMEKAVKSIRPKVMVLLESEMWPGLLTALRKYGCRTLIINGRITNKNVTRYLIWPSLWQALMPDKILAISNDDAKRFARLFEKEHVDVAPNMKFDRLAHTEPIPYANNPLREILQPGTPLLVLGSVRREEESFVERIILHIRSRLPKTVIGLFPRHLQRVKYWEEALSRLSIPWVLRSKTETHVPRGTTILWDIFGELTLAYELSRTAFVGGSLAPLGGQNFLEALTCGVIPVVGPSWDNFAWVGGEIMEQGLVRKAADWKEVADILVEDMEKPRSREKVREAALRYVRNRQGGTTQACRIIVELLHNTKKAEEHAWHE